jgi:glycopeptide antibiotics resistance protein
VNAYIFAAYCALMVWLLFGRARYEFEEMAQNFNTVPFATIMRFVRLLIGDYSLALKRHAVVNLVGNVIMFVPLGYFPPLLWEQLRKLWKCLLWGGAVIVCVELTQLTARVGRCDIDDLLLNMIGIAMGCGLYRLIVREGK